MSWPSVRLNYPLLMPLNRKAGKRRLVDMNAAEPARPWIPYLPPHPNHEIEQPLPLGEHSRCIQRLGYDEQGRLVEWAVTQSRFVDGQWCQVAIYCIHQYRLHVHLLNRKEERFTEIDLRWKIASYKDVEDSLDYVMHCLIDLEHWQENERRSDCGR